ncbi:MAG: hypothetical protein DIZ80_12540 [endosymbiont of Galathealinum brachiosum]|uniref:DUF2955 domain-containing protein n=1 Tax=endosymbiont of Galathealinum brachiosum TaxID=2200906 RepID=A0A370DEU5_9GAMM|nr:MAG: hypothetical protein DIZ80_12540 [endosymbiont of Galathealinum brachiosum]
MSTELVNKGSIRSWWNSFSQDQTQVRMLRFAVGVTLSATLAYAINWPLSFLLPVLVSFLLSTPLPVLSLRMGFRNMKQTLLAFGLGLVFAIYFLKFPAMFLILLALVMFHLYYYLNRGGSLWFTLMSFIGILLLSMMGNINEGLSMGISFGFVITAWITIIMVWVAHFIIPDPHSAVFYKPITFQPVYSKIAAKTALKSTIIILPLVGLFFVFNLRDYLLVMIFSSIFILKPELSQGKEAGIKSLVSTLLGGVYAWVFYWLIVAVPEFYFYVALVFLTTLYFGYHIFSGHENSKYYGSAIIALFVLINGSMSEGANFSELLLIRIALISLAVFYITTGLKILESYWPVDKTENNVV